jgi:Uma2 family endonuclease
LSFTKEQFPTLHRFSLEQYYELGQLGLLDRRTELLDGVIIDMEPVSPWHANIGDILSRIFNEGARGRFGVRVQYPINLGQMSQPQPDLVLYRPGMWRGQHPGAADISLVIEISDSSLVFDLGQKLALYKSAGIPEYWVVDLKATQVHRFVRRISRAKRSGTALALQHGLTLGLIYENFSPETAWEHPKNHLLTSSNVYGSRDQEPAETNCRTLQTASAAKIPEQARFGGRVYCRD